MQKKEIDIILPLYNPIEGWAQNIVNRFHQLSNTTNDIFEFSLIIVNDGSSNLNLDQGRLLIQKEIPSLNWITYEINRGKGYALRQGVQASNAPFILYTDVDFPYTNQSMLDVLNELTSGEWDAVIGTRNNSYYRSLPSSRKKISNFLKSVNARILGLKVSDTQGGLKGFTRQLKEDFLSTTIDRYLFDLEFIYLISQKKGIRIKPQIVNLREGVSFSQLKPKVLFTEGLNFLKVLFRRK